MKFLRSKPAEPQTFAYSFCESVYATPTSPHHIREVGPEGLKQGGGVPVPALCGRDLHRGWDTHALDPAVNDAARLIRLSTPIATDDNRVHVCPKCVAEYLRRTTG